MLGGDAVVSGAIMDKVQAKISQAVNGNLATPARFYETRTYLMFFQVSQAE